MSNLTVSHNVPRSLAQTKKVSGIRCCRY